MNPMYSNQGTKAYSNNRDLLAQANAYCSSQLATNMQNCSRDSIAMTRQDLCPPLQTISTNLLLKREESSSVDSASTSADAPLNADEENINNNICLLLQKKKPVPVPADMKDEQYWERRKKNNEAAKRSREIRRMKERQVAMQMLRLESENMQLRTELNVLRTELARLQTLFYGGFKVM